MKLGWLLFQYAPPDLKLSRAQKREARQRTWRLYRTTISSLAICLGTATLLGVVYGGVIMLIDAVYLGRLYPIVVVFGPLVVVALTWMAIAFAGRWIYGKAHYQALRDMGFDVCMRCGYWLRGLPATAPQCPECGALRNAFNLSAEEHAP